MRHYKKGRKLGSSASHTKAIKKNLCVALFSNDRIKTTLERAKEIRGDVDRIITWAKRGDVHSRRLAIAKLGDQNLVAEVFAKVEQGMYKDREGGYSRILRLGTRRGDAAVIVIMELVQEPVKKKKAASENKAASVEKNLKPAVASAVEDDEIIDIEAEEVVEADADASEVVEADSDASEVVEAATDDADEADADEADGEDVADAVAADDNEAKNAEVAPVDDEAATDEAEPVVEVGKAASAEASSEDTADVGFEDESKEEPKTDA